MTTRTPLKTRQFEAYTLSSKTRRRFLAAVLSTSLFSSSVAFAVTGSWDNGGADNNWQTATNWTSDVPLGATSGFANTDTAAFATTGSGNINLGDLVNIQNLNFGLLNGSANAFTIGDANDTLNLTAAGAITVGTGVANAQQIGVSGTTISLGGSGANAAFAFTNNSSTASAKLNIAGNIAGNNVATFVTTLTLGGVNGGTISGTITNGAGGGTVALKKNGPGATWTLTGNNSYTGSTLISGGTIDIGGGTANGAINGSTLSFGDSTTENGGTLAYTRTGTNTQGFAGVLLSYGKSAITTSLATQTITLAGFNRQPGGVLDISGPGTVTTSTLNTNGILGGWSTVGGSSWGTSGSAGTNTITALANGSYTASTASTTAPGATANVDFLDANSTSWSTQSINSLRFNTAAANTLTLGSGQVLTLASGGILVTSAVGNNVSAITGGSLTSSELLVHQNNTSSDLNISSVIAGGALTKSGAGVLTLSGVNTLTGRVNILEGTVKINNAAAFGASIYTTVAVGAKIDLNGLTYGSAATNNNWFGGITNSSATAATLTSGFVSSAAGVNIIDGVGDITLSGLLNGARLIKNGNNTLTITGANSNTATALVVNSGTVILNDSIADGAIRSIDLNGNAVAINGGTVQLGANEQIRSALDASTGGVAVYGGTFDINSKTETINGLQIGATDGSTAGNVISTGGGGTLTISGGSVTTPFGVSTILATNGTVSAKLAGTGATFTKTTAQTVTLSAANTYTGATAVNAGTLSVTGSLASGSVVSVASGATLRGTGTIGGATTLASGGIVAAGANASSIGTLTFSSTLVGSGSTFSLKLNSTAGTFDLITAGGAVTLGSSSLSLVDIGSGAWNGTTSAFSIVHGSSISGAFLGLANGSTVNVGANIFTLNYGASDVTLTFVSSVPEPATYAAILGAIALGAVTLRRVRRSAVKA